MVNLNCCARNLWQKWYRASTACLSGFITQGGNWPRVNATGTCNALPRQRMLQSHLITAGATGGWVDVRTLAEQQAGAKAVAAATLTCKVASSPRSRQQMLSKSLGRICFRTNAFLNARETQTRLLGPAEPATTEAGSES